MSSCCRWIATRALPPDQVLALLGLEQVSLVSSVNPQPGLYAAVLPSGWFLVLAQGWEERLALRVEDVLRLSSDGPVLMFSCDDSDMRTSIAAYAGHAAVWSLNHDGEDLETNVSGVLPRQAAEPLRRAQQTQAIASGAEQENDYLYDVPAEIGQALVGFRHDATLPSGALGQLALLRTR